MIYILIGIISGIITSMGMRRRNNSYYNINSFYEYKSKGCTIY